VPLIALPKNEAIHQVFHAELRQREIAWPTALELGSLDLVARYVAAGYGVGLAVRLPGMKLPRGVRKLALPDFPQMTFAAVWTGPLPPLGKLFVDEAGRLARELFGG
jgi:DNA-binding transcriptional LysR family regulator